MNRLTAAALGVLAFAILCFLCVRIHAPAIEQDILVRSREALAASQLPTNSIAVDGRDVTLRGVAGSDIVSARALALVDALYGVREVHAEIIIPAPAAEPSAPAPAALAPAHREAQAKLDALLADAVVEFTTGSAVLTPKGKAVLDKIAPILASQPDANCDIAGHTDNVGTPQENQVLSERRAQATKDYLVSKGIPAGRLSTAGFGATKPIASNDTEEGRQKNRRIQFQLKGAN